MMQDYSKVISIHSRRLLQIMDKTDESRRSLELFTNQKSKYSTTIDISAIPCDLHKKSKLLEDRACSYSLIPPRRPKRKLQGDTSMQEVRQNNEESALISSSSSLSYSSHGVLVVEQKSHCSRSSSRKRKLEVACNASSSGSIAVVSHLVNDFGAFDMRRVSDECLDGTESDDDDVSLLSGVDIMEFSDRIHWEKYVV